MIINTLAIVPAVKYAIGTLTSRHPTVSPTDIANGGKYLMPLVFTCLPPYRLITGLGWAFHRVAMRSPLCSM